MDEEKENTVAKPVFSGSNRFSPQLLPLSKMDSFPGKYINEYSKYS